LCPSASATRSTLVENGIRSTRIGAGIVAGAGGGGRAAFLADWTVNGR
jgi:hypothetical protein